MTSQLYANEQILKLKFGITNTLILSIFVILVQNVLVEVLVNNNDKGMLINIAYINSHSLLSVAVYHLLIGFNASLISSMCSNENVS